MFNFEMDLSSYFTCLHVLKLLLFIAAIITYDIYLSYMSVLFGIKIFNIFKYDGSMSLISKFTTVSCCELRRTNACIRSTRKPKERRR
jgi:hypothetical protein